MRFFRRAPLPTKRGNWYRDYAFPWPVAVRIVRHSSDAALDQIEYVWFETYWRRYITTAEGNWAGGDRYVLERAPAWRQQVDDGGWMPNYNHWVPIEPRDTPENDYWRSEERDG